VRPRKPWAERKGRFLSRVVFHGIADTLGTYAIADQATSVYHSALTRLRSGEPALLVKKDRASPDDIKRWYRPPTQGLQFGDREREVVTASDGEQEISVFLLRNALNDLHPKVKKFVTMVSITGDLVEAALAAGLSQAQVAAVLPGLKVKLGPLLRLAG
jgi:hypothetical protein